ncbi:hypothetical protein LguiB_018552 [Lonicera macranthoides]
MGQWSELLGELLDVIDMHLNSHDDKVRVRAVCVSWNSHLPKVHIQLPRLLQAFENQRNPTHGLYSLLESNFDLLYLPKLQGKLYKGSSYGWVVATDDSPGKTTPDIFVINPVTKVKIQLPPRYTFPDVKAYNVDNVDNEYTFLTPNGHYSMPSSFVHLHLIEKVVLSSSPSSEDCLVVAIYGEFGNLAWCRCNDNGWTSLSGNFIHGNFSPTRGSPFTDILFYKGKLHAMNQREIIVFENIGGPDQKVTQILQTPPHYTSPMYLVESSSGELLVAGRVTDYTDEPAKTTRTTLDFKLYKFDSINLSWTEVKNIGDDMMFLGLNSSLSFSSRKFLGYKGNRIYFTEDPMIFLYKENKIEDSNIGIFNLEDGTFESFPGFKCIPRFLWPPPIWVYDAQL